MDKVEAVIARRHPFEAVINRKAGGKLLMNLAYFLDHGKLAERPLDIEEHDDLRWSRLGRHHLREGLVQVTLFRNPHHRFASFYFDKIYNDSPQNWTVWREDLRLMKFNFDAGNALNAHQKNAMILLDYIEDKIKKYGLYELPDHLAPQAKFALPAQDFGFEPIEHSLANAELAKRLRGFSPRIDEAIAKLESALEVPMVVDMDEFVSGPLANRVAQIYAIDFDFFEAMRYGTT